jgi:hypothetical protein
MFVQATLDLDSTYSSHLAGMTGAYHYVQLLRVEMRGWGGSLEHFATAVVQW